MQFARLVLTYARPPRDEQGRLYWSFLDSLWMPSEDERDGRYSTKLYTYTRLQDLRDGLQRRLDEVGELMDNLFPEGAMREARVLRAKPDWRTCWQNDPDRGTTCAEASRSRRSR